MTDSVPAGVDILMYHSIGPGPAPLSIDRATFRGHLDALVTRRARVVSLSSLLGATPNAERLVALTFDDGYQDFVEAAAEIDSRGFGATVFVSTDLVEAPVGWDPDGKGRRAMMTWRDLARLPATIEIGSHAVSHRDLARLSSNAAANEIADSQAMLEDRLGRKVVSFAAPFGRTTPSVRREIQRHYRIAVGARMARTNASSDRFNLPRIEMWYFRNLRRWERYLDGAVTYAAWRKALRGARETASALTRWT